MYCNKLALRKQLGNESEGETPKIEQKGENMKNIKLECLDIYDSIHDRLNILKSVLNVIEHCDIPALYPFTINSLAYLLEEVTEALELNIRRLYDLAVGEGEQQE